MNAMETLKINLGDYGDLFRADSLDNLSDQELLSMDFILHRAWEFKKKEHRVFLDGKDWSFDDLITSHAKVREEMSRRAFQHAIKDELDEQTQPLIREAAEKQESRAGTIVQTIILDKKVFSTEAQARRWAQEHDFRVDKVDETENSFRFRQREPDDFDPDGFGRGERFRTTQLTDGVQAVIGFLKQKPEDAAVIKQAVVEAPAVTGTSSSSVQSTVILEQDPEDDLDKGVRQAFGSYGGKRFLAHKIASYIPHHRTYVEPFAGGAAVLYAKDPSPQEVLNDRDPEIAFMHRFIRDHSAEDRAALAKREWMIRKETHERLKEMKPGSDRDRFYKSFYLTRSSYGKQRGGPFNPANAGVRIDFPANIERAQARLKNVAVSNKDYFDILKEYDDPETFFYMDPPYPGKFNLFDFGFKEEKFLKALKGLKAQWIVSYPLEGAGALKEYNVYRVKRRNQMKGPGGNQEWVTELLVSNFPLKPLNLYIEKELGPIPEGMEAEAPPLLAHLDDEDELEKVQAAFKSPGGKYRLYKKIVALIPEHKTFVEGFCGGAQVFFHKKRSDIEAINDVNSDLIFAYRFIKSMEPKDLEWLKSQNWVISRGRARKMFEMKPGTPRERFYRFAYLNKSTYWGRTDVWEGVRTGPKGEGYRIGLVDRLPEIQERLRGVRLHSWDWKEVIKEYDSKDVFFYLDPPYPLHWPKEGGGHGSKFFKEEELLPVLKNIKGKFVLSYELEKVGIFKGFKTYRVKTLWTGMHQLGVRSKYELLVSNFSLKPTDLYIEKLMDRAVFDVKGLKPVWTNTQRMR